MQGARKIAGEPVREQSGPKYGQDKPANPKYGKDKLEQVGQRVCRLVSPDFGRSGQTIWRAGDY